MNLSLPRQRENLHREDSCLRLSEEHHCRKSHFSFTQTDPKMQNPFFLAQRWKINQDRVNPYLLKRRTRVGSLPISKSLISRNILIWIFDEIPYFQYVRVPHIDAVNFCSWLEEIRPMELRGSWEELDLSHSLSLSLYLSLSLLEARKT